MRIVDQGIKVVHRRAGNVAALEQRQPFGGGAAPQDVGNDAVHFVVMLRADGVIGQLRAGRELVETPDRLEERAPMFVGINKRAYIAVARRIGTPVRRQQPRIAAVAERRIERTSAEVIAEHQLRHGFEHRQLDGAAVAGAIALNERGEDRMYGVNADDAV